MTLLATRAELVLPSELALIETPEVTPTWSPIPHNFLYECVKGQVEDSGLKIEGEEHAVSLDKKRYFGVLYASSGWEHLGGTPTNGWVIPLGCRLAIGLRNSHDKSLAAAVGLGSEVTVCTNLAFSAEVVLKRKHTSFVKRDLPGLVGSAITELQNRSEQQAKAFRQFQERPINRFEACDFLFALYTQEILSNVMLGPVYDELTSKSKVYPDTAVTVWNLFNACTRQLNRRVCGLGLSRHSVELHKSCQALCDLDELKTSIPCKQVDI